MATTSRRPPPAGCFMLSDFLDLLARERRWCELLLITISIRAELRPLDAKSIADDLISRSLKWRGRR
jgi:membrane protein insertase Oxa1/YidC/SpoIIIJ